MFGPIFPNREHRRAVEWLLLLVPPSLICAGVLGALLIPNVRSVENLDAYLQVFLWFVSLAAGSVSAGAISQYLSRGSKVGQVVISFIQGPLIVFTLWAIFQIIDFGWS